MISLFEKNKNKKKKTLEMKLSLKQDKQRLQDIT